MEWVEREEGNVLSCGHLYHDNLVVLCPNLLSEEARLPLVEAGRAGHWDLLWLQESVLVPSVSR